jgi:hypothetical protein
MPTLQPRASSADCAVLDVPSAIAATRQPNAQVKARELIIVLVNFGFIVIISFYLIFLVLAFFDFSLLSCHFWPFTEVLRKIFGSLTREVLETFARRWKNEDSFGRAAETNTRTCEHNGKSAAIRESIVLPR